MSDEKPRVRKPRTPEVIVDVTQTEIDLAIPRDSGHCMISDAVRAAFPNAKSVSTDLQTIRFSDSVKGLRYTYLTPRIAQVALVRFDQGIPPEPFRFRLRRGQVSRAGKKPAVKPDLLARAELRGPAHEGVPSKVGGRTPPIAAHAGKRRAFGLRALEL